MTDKILDEFNVTQTITMGNSSTIANAGWLPTNSNRQITNQSGSIPPASFIDISSTTANRLFFTVINSPGFPPVVLPFSRNATLAYSDPGAPGSSYDFSNVISISLEDVAITSGTGTVSIQITRASPMPLVLTAGPFPLLVGTNTFIIATIFPGADLSDVTEIRFIFESDLSGFPFIANIERIDSLLAPLICVAKDTNILMADGTEKLIQDIQRGDIVMGPNNTTNKVARILRKQLASYDKISIVTIAKDSLSKNQPHTNTIMTSGHPILHNGERRRAQCYKKLPGVKYYSQSKTKASDKLPIDDNNKTYSLYNIQYETKGYYVANGLTVSSIPPCSSILPLPKELYFTKELCDIESEIPSQAKTLYVAN